MIGELTGGEEELKWSGFAVGRLSGKERTLRMSDV